MNLGFKVTYTIGVANHTGYGHTLDQNKPGLIIKGNERGRILMILMAGKNVIDLDYSNPQSSESND
jgi:hypothetical protein